MMVCYQQELIIFGALATSIDNIIVENGDKARVHNAIINNTIYNTKEYASIGIVSE